MSFVRRLALAAVLVAPAAAIAQESGGHVQKPIEIDFEVVEIWVEVVRPNVGFVMETTHEAHPSLIKLRGDFAQEMAASLDEVR